MLAFRYAETKPTEFTDIKIPSFELILNMVKATYRGTVLSGRDNFDTWKKDLMKILRAEDLGDFVDRSAEDPSIDKEGKTEAVPAKILFSVLFLGLALGLV